MRGTAGSEGSVRAERIAVLFGREARAIERQVARRANAPSVVIQDACQTAWMRLCARPDIDVESERVVGWLVVTSVREAWRLAARQRETPVGGWSPEPAAGELPEPVGGAVDPLDLVIEHEHSDELRERLSDLTVRERRFLGLQAAGLSYAEIAQTGVTQRTVERQIVRGRRKLRARRAGQ